MFKYLSLLVASAGIFLAVNLVRNQKTSVPAPPPLAEPASAPYPDSIGARGIIESLEENVRIAPAVAGLVVSVPVKVGDSVRIGEVLIQQDTRDADAQIEVQQANVGSINASIDEAEVSLADRQDQWDRIEKLGENRVVSVDEKQRTLFALRAAKSRLASRRADLAAAHAQLARARIQRELLLVRAPRDGTILQVNVRAGEYAAPSAQETPLLLGRIDSFQLRADVDEDNAPRVRTGCEGVAFIKGQRNGSVPLQFVRIEPYILPKRSLSGESTERVDTRVLQVIFRFERPATPVYVGQQMDVFLKGETSTP
jgi:multidrug efflux pump subunit AcrA (membrane-fusion protein)